MASTRTAGLPSTKRSTTVTSRPGLVPTLMPRRPNHNDRLLDDRDVSGKIGLQLRVATRGVGGRRFLI